MVIAASNDGQLLISVAEVLMRRQHQLVSIFILTQGVWAFSSRRL